MATLTQLFYWMYPGDDYTINFPEPITLETKSGETFDCYRMNAWYWDEEDHRCLDFYFYGNDPKAQWIAKQYYLTYESYSRLCDFLVENKLLNK